MTVVTGELLARIANAMAHCLTVQKSFRLSGTEIAVKFFEGDAPCRSGWNSNVGCWEPGDHGSPDEAEVTISEFVWNAPLDDDGEPWDIGEWFHECLELPEGFEYSLKVSGDALVITANSDEWNREEAA